MWILKSSTHWFRKILFVSYVLAIIWTSLAYAFENKVTSTSIPSSRALLRVAANPRGRLRVRAYVEGAAKTRGVNPQIAEWIVTHESGHHPEATGDGGQSRGLWQINKAWHPEISDACAYNVTCSTDWSLERIRAGYIDEWSTWKYCKELMGHEELSTTMRCVHLSKRHLGEAQTKNERYRAAREIAEAEERKAAQSEEARIQ